MGAERLTQWRLPLARCAEGSQREQENAGGGENHDGGGELDCGSLSAAHEARAAYLSRRRGRPGGRPTAALPSVQPQGKQTALASAFKAPPSAAEPGSGEETESRGLGMRVVGRGISQDRPPALSFTCLRDGCVPSLQHSWRGSEPHSGSSQLTLGETESRVA